MGDTVILIVTLVLMFGAMWMTLIPAFPAIPFMFLLALGYGVVDKFIHISGWNLLILAGIALVSMLVDYLSGILGAKYGGAGRKAIIYGFIGMLIGTLIAPPFGSLLGLFLGVFFSEIIEFKDHHRAIKSAMSSVLGAVVGIMINFAIAFIFIGVFVSMAIK